MCLTFDDGLHSEHTPRLLDMLGELGIKATLFLLAGAIVPDIVAAAGASGGRFSMILQMIGREQVAIRK